MRRLGDVIVGLVLGIALSSGAWLFYVGRVVDPQIASVTAKADALTAQHVADSALADSSLKQQARHDVDADRVSRRAENIRLGTVAQRIPAVCLTPSARADSSVIMVPLDTALAWKYAWEAERTARLHATQVLIPDLLAVQATDRRLIAALRDGIALRDRKIRALEMRNRLNLPIGIGVGALIVWAVVGLAR